MAIESGSVSDAERDQRSRRHANLRGQQNSCPSGGRAKFWDKIFFAFNLTGNQGEVWPFTAPPPRPLGTSNEWLAIVQAAARLAWLAVKRAARVLQSECIILHVFDAPR